MTDKYKSSLPLLFLRRELKNLKKGEIFFSPLEKGGFRGIWFSIEWARDKRIRS
jgi:hypothetical protein